MKNQKIVPCLLFSPTGADIKEAVDFYASVFDNFKTKNITYYTKASAAVSGMPENSVMTVEFEIEGMDFVMLNGPEAKMNPSISFFVNCETEAEVITIWDKLSQGGKILMSLDKYDYSDKYGWVEDKFGISWQIMCTPSGDSLSEKDIRPKIVPNLMFTNEKSGKARKAIDFYTSIFDDSKIGFIAMNDKPGAAGTIAFADFMIENIWFSVMDNPQKTDFGFNESISFYVNCKDQKEIDYFWKKLTDEGGEESVCGWLKDQFGISWQIVPENINKLISSPEAMQAMMKMKKIDIQTLKNHGKS